MMHVQRIGEIVRYMKHANRRDFIDAALLNVLGRRSCGADVVLRKNYDDTVKYTCEYVMCRVLVWFY